MVLIEYADGRFERKEENIWLCQMIESIGMMTARREIYNRIPAPYLTVYNFLDAIRHVSRDEFNFSFDYDMVDLYVRKLVTADYSVSDLSQIGCLRAQWKNVCWRFVLDHTPENVIKSFSWRETYHEQFEDVLKGGASPFTRQCKAQYPLIFTSEYGMNYTEL